MLWCHEHTGAAAAGMPARPVGAGAGNEARAVEVEGCRRHHPLLRCSGGGRHQNRHPHFDSIGDGTAAETCRLIKQRIGADPNGQKLAHHLLTDGRVRWALDSGMTPGGQKQAVPGGYGEWKRDVEDWIRDGMRCE